MARTSNKKLAHAIVYVNYAIVALLTYFIYRHQTTVFSIGGSSLLLPVSIIIITLVFVIKPLALELSFALLHITTIFVINFLSYLEIRGNSMDTTFWIISFFGLFYFVNSCSWILRAPFKNYDEIIESDRSLFLKILLTLSLPVFIIGLVFGMLSALAVYDIRLREPVFAGSHPFLKISYVAVAWLVLSLVVTFIYLSKIRDQDIRKFFIETKLGVIRYDTAKLKKYYASIFLCIIFLGSFIELQRGMWIMWIETTLLAGLMSLILWKIYKHAFISETE